MPSAPYVVPPLWLIVTLVVSAIAKVRDPHDTASVFRQLGLPQVLLRLRAPRLLPYGELVVAALLLLTHGRWYVVAASASLLLFAAYFLVILHALRLPYPVTCSCFGRLGLGEVTRRTLARNGVLLALALVTWADAWRGDGVAQRLGQPGGLAWGLGALLVAGLGVLLVVRRRRGLSLPVDDRDPLAYNQSPTPEGALHRTNGPVRVWDLSDAAARLLVFCDPSRDVEVVARSRTWATRVRPVVVHLVTEAAPSGAWGDGLLHDPGGVYRQALGVGSPGAVLLGTDRKTAGGPVDGLDEMTALVDAMSAELGVAERQ